MEEVLPGVLPARVDFRFYLWSAAAFAAGAAGTAWFCVSMPGGMAMPGGWTMSMMWMRMPGQSWPEAAEMFIVMWGVMMVPMMLPSAVPMLRSYAVQGDRAGRVALQVAAGYFGTWTAFGAAIYLPGALWAQATMSSARLSALVPVLTGLALIVAGLIQFSPMKMKHLLRCRDRSGCSPGAGGLAFTKGVSEGRSCIICCSGHMIALVALGAMDPLVMIVIAAIIAAEKLLPRPELTSRIAGIAGFAAGALFLLRGRI